MADIVSDHCPGPGWWLASDGKWYAPHLAPSSWENIPVQRSERVPDDFLNSPDLSKLLLDRSVPVRPIEPNVSLRSAEIKVRSVPVRAGVLLMILCSLLVGIVGAAVGVVVARLNEHTIVERYLPDTSVAPVAMNISHVLSVVEPAVVIIECNDDIHGQASSDAGTGMIVTPSGEVLTNNHVVAGAVSITVYLFGQSTPVSASVIRAIPSQDVALLQLRQVNHSLPVVSFGNSSDVQVGDAVLTIGNALNLSGGLSVTTGIISGENRTLTATNALGQKEHVTGVLQTDAPISPGNSGGPLVDAQAQVVGMNSAVASSKVGNATAQNVSLSIASNTLLADLRILQGK